MRKIALSINLFTIFYNFHDKYFSPLSSLTNILRVSGGRNNRGGGGLNHGGGRSGGHSGWSSVQCQVCFKNNHTAFTCYNRYNPQHQASMAIMVMVISNWSQNQN